MLTVKVQVVLSPGKIFALKSSVVAPEMFSCTFVVDEIVITLKDA